MKFLSESEVEKFIESAKKNFCFSDVCRDMGWPINGIYINVTKRYIEKYNCDISHFNGALQKKYKYNLIEKECPVCGAKFITREGHKREKTTCSHACSNTYFRTANNNGRWIKNRDETKEAKYYVKICFSFHDYKCIICGEDKTVDVHHLDKNRENNTPENLVPLCPTHHRYMHRKYKELIMDKVEEYVNNFILTHPRVA
jgi:hypothetical protein